MLFTPLGCIRLDTAQFQEHVPGVHGDPNLTGVWTGTSKTY